MEQLLENKTEDERTTAIGLYHYARSYHEAAKALVGKKLDSTHPDAPIAFLQYHAIELFLKAFLRLKGASVRDLRAIGHRAITLSEEAVKRGFDLDDDEAEVIRMMSEGDTIPRSRYIKTGPFVIPSPEARNFTCASLRRKVGSDISATGSKVRP